MMITVLHTGRYRVVYECGHGMLLTWPSGDSVTQPVALHAGEGIPECGRCGREPTIMDANENDVLGGGRMTPDELRHTREALGYSLRGLAAVLGVDHMTVYRWEHGRHPIPQWLPLALRALSGRTTQ